MTTSTIETVELETKSTAIVMQAKASVIRDAVTFEAAAGLLMGIKALRKEVDETFDGPISAAHKAHKEICAAKKKHEAPLVEAEGIIKDRIGTYTDEQERIRRQEQIRLEAEARKREEDARLAEAAAVERMGDHEEAARMIEAPIEAPAVVLPRATPKVSGISTSETWGAQVVDRVALIKHVAAHPELVHLLEPNMVALNQQARSLKGQMSLPGVRAVATRNVRAGGA